MRALNPLRIFHLPKKVWIPLILILLGAGYYFFVPQGKVDVPVYATVKKEDLKATVSASGILTGKNTANLKFKSSGKLAYVNIKEGDKVTKGQTVAGLDTQDLSIALQQAQNTLRDKQAITDKIIDDLHSTLGTSIAETYLQRQTRTTAEAARDSAFDSVKAAQRAFQDAVIVSPLDGTVTQIPPLSGQNIGATDTIAQVVNWDSGVYFDTDIDEADVFKVAVSQNAEVTLNAYGDQVFNGTVAEILPQTKTTSSGATVVTVRINLNNPPIKLIANLNGQASIIINQVTNVLAVPQEALSDNGKVVVKTGAGLESRTVRSGLKSDVDVEIISGLNEGDQVVTNPAPFVNKPATAPNPINRFFRQFRPGR